MAIDTTNNREKRFMPAGNNFIPLVEGLNRPNPFAMNPEYWANPLDSAAHISQFGTPEQQAAAANGRYVNSQGVGGGVLTPLDPLDFRSPMVGAGDPGFAAAYGERVKNDAARELERTKSEGTLANTALEGTNRVMEAGTQGAYGVKQQEAAHQWDMPVAQAAADAVRTKTQQTVDASTEKERIKQEENKIKNARADESLALAKEKEARNKQNAEIAQANMTYPGVQWGDATIQRMLVMGVPPLEIAQNVTSARFGATGMTGADVVGRAAKAKDNWIYPPVK